MSLPSSTIHFCYVLAISSQLSIIRQRYNIEPLVHITCRDRNLIGLQSHLLGLSLIGVNEILAITGDPSKVGHPTRCHECHDVNSKGLTELALRFNQGINTDGDAEETYKLQHRAFDLMYANLTVQ